MAISMGSKREKAFVTEVKPVSARIRIAAKIADFIYLFLACLAACGVALVFIVVAEESRVIGDYLGAMMGLNILLATPLALMLLNLTTAGSLGKRAEEICIVRLNGDDAPLSVRVRRWLVHYATTLFTSATLAGYLVLRDKRIDLEYLLDGAVGLLALDVIVSSALVLTTGRSTADWVSGTVVGKREKRADLPIQGFEVISQMETASPAGEESVRRK